MQIDKKRNVHLVPVRTLDQDTQMRIREIRNQLSVRRWMYTDHIITSEEHVNFLHRVSFDPRQWMFAVIDEDQLVGVASVNSVDVLHKKADWAFYLSEQARGGLGSAIEFALIDFVFDKLAMEKLNCEVIDGNDSVLKLHKKFLFQIEGLRRSQITKDGTRRGVHLLGLTKEDWQEGRAEVHQKYSAVLDKFMVEIRD